MVEVDRGGLATYHGPGQLVGYPILDLRPRNRDVHRYLRGPRTGTYQHVTGVRHTGPARTEKKTGVWVGDRKIASIGVRFSRWISSHGFALNVTTDLSYFSHIVPCGMPTVTMTSVAQESSVAQEADTADMAWLRERIAHHLAQVFALRYLGDFPPTLCDMLAAVQADRAVALR